MFQRNKYRYTRSMVYDYSRVSRLQHRRANRNRVRKLFIGSVYFFIGTFLLYIIAGVFFTSPSDHFSPIVAPIQESVDTSVQEIAELFSQGLKNTVESSLANSEGTYGIYIKNLKTEEQYALNEHKHFVSASLYKLWTMGAVYEHIENGTLEKNQVAAASIEELNQQHNIASEEAELTEGDIRRTIDDAMEEMITISDNYSALLLTSTVKSSSIRDFLQTYGLTESVVGNKLPETTASDIGKYFELLYNKKIVNDIYSEEMMARLKRQRLNDRIPKELPENIQVAHKTGELYGFKHDAGIVFAPNGDYILVVLSDTSNPVQASKQIAQLSKNIYDYFESK